MKRKDYPPDWPEISRRIRFERAGGTCEQCGVAHGAVGARDCHGVWHDEEELDSMSGTVGDHLFPDGFPKIIKIVLTCAHYPDSDPLNCADDNLQALCQRCHFQLDAPLHQARARLTRMGRRGLQPTLFDVAAARR